VAEEAGAERPQRIGDADPQAVTRTYAGFLPGISPALPWAVGRARRTSLPRLLLGPVGGAAKAAGVGQQPEGHEVGIQLLSEDRLEVDFHVDRPGQAGVVTQDAQPQAVADDCPQRSVRRVERLLRQHEGRAAANLAGLWIGLAEAVCRRIEILAVCGKDQGHAAVAGDVTDVVSVARGLDDGTGFEVGVAQGVLQQRQQEFAQGQVVGVEVGALALGLEVGPEVECDLPVAGDFVAQLEPFGNAVVDLGLLGTIGVLQAGEPGEFVGRNEPTFDANCLVGKLGGTARHDLGPRHGRDQHVDAHDVDGQAGGDLIGAPGFGGVPHAAMVLQ
jgi:hypothetical protein